MPRVGQNVEPIAPVVQVCYQLLHARQRVERVQMPVRQKLRHQRPLGFVLQAGLCQRSQSFLGQVAAVQLDPVGGIKNGCLQPQRLFPDQLPAQIQRGLKVHIIIPAHQLAEGAGMGGAIVEGQTGLVVDGGLPGGQVHPDLQVVAFPQGLAQRAHAVHHHGALGLFQLFFERLHLFGVLQAFIALHEAAAVQQHGVAVAVGGQIGSQLFIQLFFVHGQRGRVDQPDVFHKFFQLTGQRADLRARVAVDTHAGLAGLDLPGDLLRHGLGAFDQPVLHGLGGVNGIDRIGIHIGIGMEHKTHGFFLLYGKLEKVKGKFWAAPRCILPECAGRNRPHPAGPRRPDGGTLPTGRAVSAAEGRRSGRSVRPAPACRDGSAGR